MHLLTRKHSHTLLWFARFALICALVAFAAPGCKDHPKDKLREGRSALAAKNPDLAEAKLNEALKADPNMIEARRLMIDVHLLRDDYQKAEQTLIDLWNDLGFDRPANQIPTDERSNRQLMADQFNDLYRRWAESISPTQQPEKFEEVLKKGLAHNPRSTRLNTLLVDFYKEQAEKYLEHDQKLKAAETLEKIPDLLTLPNTRQAVTTRAQTLRQQAFNDTMIARFEADIKPELLEQNLFDADNNAVRINLSHPVSRRLLPKTPADYETAKQEALDALKLEIARTAIKIASLSPETDPDVFTELPFKITDEKFVRGNFSLVASVPLTNIWDTSYRLVENQRLEPSKTQNEHDQD